MKQIRFKDKIITLLITLPVLSVFIMSCSLSTTVAIQPEPIQSTLDFPPPEPNLVIPNPSLESTFVIEPTDAPPILESSPTTQPPILYYTQAGDTLNSIGVRFNVDKEEITSTDEVPENSLIKPGLLLIIPNHLDETSPGTLLLPDSEIVNSPSALDFNVYDFVQNTDGYLKTYREYRSEGWFTGPELIERVAIENSISPRLLLAMLEHESNWVYGQPSNISEQDYPMGWVDFHDKGLYKQLSWAVQQISIGYYGWRAGLVNELSYPDGDVSRIAPQLNAGTVALQYLYSRLYNPQDWTTKLYGSESLVELHVEMFGNPWDRAQNIEPLYPPNLKQPILELPFRSGRTWSLTGGPHSAWGPDGALAALDFAPMMSEHGCVETDDWVTAISSGLVVRSEHGAVLVDLDGDGKEETGWVILYMHIATNGRVQEGQWINTNDLIGHPSCEGGVSTGTHLHIARKYNGEWILADGPLPFVMDNWQAHAGDEPYLGYLEKNDQIVQASIFGSFESRIARP